MPPILAAALLTSAAQAQIVYPAAHTVGQSDDYFGTHVADPYRWMENVDSPEVAHWVAAENTLTRGYLDAIPGREKMHARLMDLTNFERYTPPSKHGPRYFYSHNQGLQNQNVVYWQQGLAGEPKVLLDPNTMSADGTVALGTLALTDDGALAAYSIAEAGSDWITWHVRDVATGKDLPDIVHWSKFSGASWLKDNSGFYYSGYDAPAPGTTAAEALKTANYYHKVFFHKLGTTQTEDKLVYERPDDKELNVGASVTDDGHYLVLQSVKGTSPNSDLYIKDLAHPDTPIVKVVTVADAVYNVIDNDGTTFWVQTTLNAPNGKIIAIDLAHPEREHWKTIVPETKNNLDSVSMVHDTLILKYLADAQNLVELYSPAGKLIQQLKLPAIGTADGFGGRRHDDETFFQFTNFTTPGTVYRLDMKTLHTTLYKQPKLQFDPAVFETKQVFYTSKDGTKVPMFITYKKGLKLDGTNPTLLYGYGGFNISLMPQFASSYVLWMELGGVYAQPSLRGGGEYGESWHRAGTKHQKQNVFDDFIAAAEYLIANKYTSPAKLAISGGSNGGLLVGAVELQRPDLFGAVIAQVGVMDMLRFDKFTIGWAWKDDYGDPSGNQADFAAIYKYSPLHNVRPGVAYPPTLITTADHDDRVFPAHSFKFAATMQATITQDATAQTPTKAGPVLIRIETRAGHGAGMPLSKRLDVVVDQYSFLTKELNMQSTQ